jgi:8-oxo-dGTP pyrophosphatase MutT (NUDIX family)
MTYLFDDALRDEVAARCAGFSRLPADPAALALKPASVAITIADTGDGSGRAAILLTRRAKSLRAHSGQWALPGGRCDPGETPEGAALRELCEELGLKLDGNAVLGLLDDYATRSGYAIKPVVVWAAANATLNPNPLEVASVHRVPLADFTREEALSFISIPESERPVIRLQVMRSFIHAPTAAVIYQFLELLSGRTTRVFDLEQPVFAWR